MAIGASGRIVVEIDPDLKKELYSALNKDGRHLKQWFLEHIESFFKEKAQPNAPLFGNGNQIRGING